MRNKGLGAQTATKPQAQYPLKSMQIDSKSNVIYQELPCNGHQPLRTGPARYGVEFYQSIAAESANANRPGKTFREMNK